MADMIATALAGLVAILFGVALLAMTVGRLSAAGASFLGASIVIYLRERRI